MMDYQFEMVETAEQPVLAVRTVTAVGNLPQVLGQAFQAVAAYIGGLGEQPADAPFVAYYNMDMENLNIEIGFPVSKVLPGQGEIIPDVIPAGKKSTCLYKGPYQEMVPVYDGMNKWLSDNGHEPTGVVYEFYYNSPMEVPESELLTKIVFLLK
jgi:effector-binding domain-containing protein